MGNTSSDNEKDPDPDPPAPQLPSSPAPHPAPQQLSRGFWRQAGRQRRQEAEVFGYNHEYAEKLKEEDIRTQFGSQYHQRDWTFELNVEQMKNWKRRVYDDKTEKFWSDDDYRQYWEYAAYESKIRMASIGHGSPGDLDNHYWRWAERRKKRKREEQDERDREEQRHQQDHQSSRRRDKRREQDEHREQDERREQDKRREQDERDREEQRHQQDQSSRRTRPGLTQADTDCPWYQTVEKGYQQLAEKGCIERPVWRDAMMAMHPDRARGQSQTLPPDTLEKCFEASTLIRQDIQPRKCHDEIHRAYT